jgi:uncharacterized protein YndB with AHSA1/START domain
MRTIERSVTIDAPAPRVWEVVTQSQYMDRWGRAFMQDIRTDIDVAPGGQVWWRSEGHPTIRGRIAELKDGRFMKVEYPRALNTENGDMGGDFAETFGISDEDGGARLTITCGPINDEAYQMLDGPWDEALASIKRLAEDPIGRSADVTRPQPRP